MKKSIFEYRDYKAYLLAWLQQQPHEGHGLRSKLAAFAGCNTTYVTQVLNGTAHFSVEQGEQITRFLGLAREEMLFFLHLIQHARAGTATLRSVIEQQIEQMVGDQFNLKKRLEFKKALSVVDQMTYYSAWYFSAIHVVLSMKHLQTKEALCKYFGLSLKTVVEVLNFLTSVGLAVEKHGRFEVGHVSIHLGKDSPAISKHHVNWRTRAIGALENRDKDSLHYSSVVTVSKNDEPKIKAILVDAIEKIRSVVKESREEGAYCYAIDFFSLER